MASPAQAAANLANAQLSTGPRTEQGKRRSCRNATTHGLTSKEIVIEGESQAEFDAFREGLLHDLAPANAEETDLAEQLIAARWRLRRIPRLEAEIFGPEGPDFRLLNILSLHAGRLTRVASTVRKDLTLLQDQRRDREEKELEAAICLRKADLAQHRPTHLDQFGFVLKLEQVDRKIRLHQALAEARILLKTAGTRKAA